MGSSKCQNVLFPVQSWDKPTEDFGTVFIIHLNKDLDIFPPCYKMLSSPWTSRLMVVNRTSQEYSWKTPGQHSGTWLWWRGASSLYPQVVTMKSGQRQRSEAWYVCVTVFNLYLHVRVWACGISVCLCEYMCVCGICSCTHVYVGVDVHVICLVYGDRLGGDRPPQGRRVCFFWVKYILLCY